MLDIFNTRKFFLAPTEYACARARSDRHAPSFLSADREVSFVKYYIQLLRVTEREERVCVLHAW